MGCSRIIIKECEYCGRDFEVTYSHRAQRCCNHKCALVVIIG